MGNIHSVNTDVCVMSYVNTTLTEKWRKRELNVEAALTGERRIDEMENDKNYKHNI